MVSPEFAAHQITQHPFKKAHLSVLSAISRRNDSINLYCKLNIAHENPACSRLSGVRGFGDEFDQ